MQKFIIYINNGFFSSCEGFCPDGYECVLLISHCIRINIANVNLKLFVNNPNPYRFPDRYHINNITNFVTLLAVSR